MGPGLISFLLAAGGSTWLYSKFQKYSGNNTKQSMIASAVAALVIFLVSFSILKMIF